MAAVEAAGKAVAVAQGTGSSTRAARVAAVAALCTVVVTQARRQRQNQGSAIGEAGLRWLGRAEDEVNLKKPSPPSFYKLLGSRTVTWHISL